MWNDYMFALDLRAARNVVTSLNQCIPKNKTSQDMHQTYSDRLLVSTLQRKVWFNLKKEKYTVP